MTRGFRKGCLYTIAPLAILYATQVAIGIWDRNLPLGEALIQCIVIPAVLVLSWMAVLALYLLASLWYHRHHKK